MENEATQYVDQSSLYLSHWACPESPCKYLKSFQEYLFIVREYIFKCNPTCFGIFKRGDHMTSSHQYHNIFVLVFSIADEACTNGLPVECFKYLCGKLCKIILRCMDTTHCSFNLSKNCIHYHSLTTVICDRCLWDNHWLCVATRRYCKQLSGILELNTYTIHLTL